MTTRKHPHDPHAEPGPEQPAAAPLEAKIAEL
jgi:hypothetical protein